MIILLLVTLYLAFMAYREYRRDQLSKRRFALANEIARLMNKDIK